MVNEVEISSTRKYKIASTHALFSRRRATAKVRVSEDIRAKIKQNLNFCGKAQRLKLSLFKLKKPLVGEETLYIFSLKYISIFQKTNISLPPS